MVYVEISVEKSHDLYFHLNTSSTLEGSVIYVPTLQNEKLYLGTDGAVLQVPVAQCNSYSSCTDCVHDPYCGWHSATRT